MRDEREVDDKRRVLEAFYRDEHPATMVMDGASFGMGYLAALRWVQEE